MVLMCPLVSALYAPIVLKYWDILLVTSVLNLYFHEIFNWTSLLYLEILKNCSSYMDC